MNKISYSGVLNENNFSATLFFFQLRRIFARLYHLLKKLFEMNLWSIEGTSTSDKDLKILFIGNGTDVKYFSNLFFKDPANATFIGKVWLWRISYYLLMYRKQYDIFIFQSKKNICNFLSSKKNIVIPDWISCEIDLKTNTQSAAYSSNIKKNIKKIRRMGYIYNISKDPNDFEFFYNTMYFPYVSERYGKSLVNIDYKTIKKNFENGELILIKNGQKIVSGGIINYSLMKGIPRATQLGVYNGDFNYVKNGALIAFYYYLIEYLKEKGHEKVNLGGTRPFFNDGVLKHKLSWGAKIISESSNAFLLCCISNKNFVKNFCLNNPFICIANKKLSLSVVANSNSNIGNMLPVPESKLKSYGIDQVKIAYL